MHPASANTPKPNEPDAPVDERDNEHLKPPHRGRSPHTPAGTAAEQVGSHPLGAATGGIGGAVAGAVAGIAAGPIGSLAGAIGGAVAGAAAGSGPTSPQATGPAQKADDGLPAAGSESPHDEKPAP